MLKRRADPTQEAGAIGAVDNTMIVGQRERQMQTWRKFPTVPDRLHLSGGETEDGDLGGTVGEWGLGIPPVPTSRVKFTCR